jgi:hypothetical protein
MPCADQTTCPPPPKNHHTHPPKPQLGCGCVITFLYRYQGTSKQFSIGMLGRGPCPAQARPVGPPDPPVVAPSPNPCLNFTLLLTKCTVCSLILFLGDPPLPFPPPPKHTHTPLGDLPPPPTHTRANAPPLTLLQPLNCHVGTKAQASSSSSACGRGTTPCASQASGATGSHLRLTEWRRCSTWCRRSSEQ